MNSKTLDKYFKKDKSSWFVVDAETKNKIWDKEKLNEFWSNIRDYKMRNYDYNFRNYIFPPSQSSYEDIIGDVSNIAENDNDFWFKGDSKKFKKEVIFSKAIFLEKIDFNKVVFENSSNFDECVFSFSGFRLTQFKKEANFRKALFLERYYFIGTKFDDKTDFSYADFKKEGFFKRSSFSKESKFYNTIFRANPDFKFSQFHDKVIFSEAKFCEDKAIFLGTVFLSGSDFKNTVFVGNKYMRGLKKEI